MEENLNRERIPDRCPHCGHKLSPWQQVLLNVDRILTCKNCWYKIILTTPPTKDQTEIDESLSSQNDKD
jgi:DNA-directed RNA polymerase subunit RPC12/RpoP